MPISQSLLPEFENEMAGTRKTLERVPEDKFAWKPHPKSWPLVNLATHVAQIPGWGKMTMDVEQLDIAPPGQPPPQPVIPRSRQEILDLFEKNVADARAALSAAPDEAFMKTWTLLSGGKVILAMPRIAIWRGFVMNHLIHHRAQLGVYLRLNDIPVPSLYGPSADEGGF
jgi:uncharacterized damage-inducible protein DinB